MSETASPLFLSRQRYTSGSASRPALRPASHALLLTWQRTSAFNQPLSFDTFKVTTMETMFMVRFARA